MVRYAPADTGRIATTGTATRVLRRAWQLAPLSTPRKISPGTYGNRTRRLSSDAPGTHCSPLTVMSTGAGAGSESPSPLCVDCPHPWTRRRFGFVRSLSSPLLRVTIGLALSTQRVDTARGVVSSCSPDVCSRTLHARKTSPGCAAPFVQRGRQSRFPMVRAWRAVSFHGQGATVPGFGRMHGFPRSSGIRSPCNRGPIGLCPCRRPGHVLSASVIGSRMLPTLATAGRKGPHEGAEQRSVAAISEALTRYPFCTPPNSAAPFPNVAIVFRYQRVQGAHRGDSALV